MIEWLAFLQVFAAALLGAMVIVGCYAVGLRLLVRSGHAPVVAPADFTDAITVISPKAARRAARAAAKAAAKSPLSDAQKQVALVGAYASFAVCALAVVGGVTLIVVH